MDDTSYNYLLLRFPEWGFLFPGPPHMVETIYSPSLDTLGLTPRDWRRRNRQGVSPIRYHETDGDGNPQDQARNEHRETDVDGNL